MPCDLAYWGSAEKATSSGYGGALIKPTVVEDYFGPRADGRRDRTFIIAQKCRQVHFGGLVATSGLSRGTDERGDVSVDDPPQPIVAFFPHQRAHHSSGRRRLRTTGWPERDGWQVPRTLALEHVLRDSAARSSRSTVAGTYYYREKRSSRRTGTSAGWGCRSSSP